MTAVPDHQRDFLLREYDRLAGDLMHYFDTIVATERLALGAAAATVAFLYTDLPTFAAGPARILAGLPAAIVALAGLRCLSIYLVMTFTSGYLRRVEEQLCKTGFGYQREFSRRSSGTERFIEATTTLLWILALSRGAVRLVDLPAAASRRGAAQCVPVSDEMTRRRAMAPDQRPFQPRRLRV